MGPFKTGSTSADPISLILLTLLLPHPLLITWGD